MQQKNKSKKIFINIICFQPKLSGSFAYATLLLPSEMFNGIPQSPGLEEHPGVPGFTGNVAANDLPGLACPASLLLRLINQAFRLYPDRPTGTQGKDGFLSPGPVRDYLRRGLLTTIHILR